MKRYLWILAVVLVSQSAGCYWMSGPWYSANHIRREYNEIEVGQLQSEVQDELGDPSEIMYVTGPDGRAAPESKEAWLLYKYDYATDPLLITIKVDRFGIVTEKHLDDKKTVAEEAARHPVEEQASYPGAPQRQFMELIKKKTKGEVK